MINKIDDLEYYTCELESEIENLENKNKELHEKYVELLTKIRSLETKNAESQNLIMNTSLQLVPAFRSILQMMKVSQELSDQSNTDSLSKLKSELQEKCSIRFIYRCFQKCYFIVTFSQGNCRRWFRV